MARRCVRCFTAARGDLDGEAGYVMSADSELTRSQQHYRYWILWRCPSVRFFDYQKVKDAERAKAAELFGTPTEPTALASKVNPPTSRSNPSKLLKLHKLTTPQQILNIKSHTFDVPASSTPGDLNGTGTSDVSRVKLTDKERKRVELMIRNAKTLAEMTRLEKELSEGRIPSGFDEMEE